ncbi:MAG: hypothetical protein J6K81_05360 [Rikenellaceae bacterium]|nr:hypothetical protein [Rikenellaceae bacterium]
MATISTEILEGLSNVIRQFHTTLKRAGVEGIKSDLANCKWTNPFGLSIILTKWDEILSLLDKLAITLKKGNIDDIINIAADLSKCVADIQLVILKSAAEVGSFVPGPIGMVCSLALAVGCFAVGDVLGGFLNLVGAIPGAKLAKYIPVGSIKPAIINFKNILCSRCGYSVSTLTQKVVKSSEKFKCIEIFDDYFARTIKKAKDSISRVGEKIENKNKEILTKIDDGWNATREELQAEKAFEYMLNQSI